MYELNQNQKNLIAGYRLAQVMAAVGRTIDELSLDTGISRKNLEDFFNGETKLNSEQASRLKQVLSADIGEIFAFAEQPQRHPDVNGYADADELELRPSA